MKESILYSLSGSLCAGIVAQWLAARLKLPAILLLLVVGILAGPVTGLLHPEESLGPLLLPIVSLSVAIVLFEGGLSLKVKELQGHGHLVVRLVAFGVPVSWGLITVCMHTVAGLTWPVSSLMGAILSVTGPTVVGPLLAHVRPRDPVAAILRWEGIVIDPVGAALAVTVFEGVVTQSSANPVAAMLTTLLAGCVVGAVGAGIVYLVLRRRMVSDELEGSVTLMLVLVSFTVSQWLHADSGLYAVTIMGVLLANQSVVNVKHIIDFKENLRVMLLGFLFVNLGAGLHLSDLTAELGRGLGVIVLMIFVVRPLCVLASTLGSRLPWADRVFMAWMAPRGIVAASVASVFGLRLASLGDAQAAQIVPLTFLTIIVTVLVYSLSAKPLAHALKVALPNPQGVMLVGAHEWAQQMALALQTEGISVVLVDTDYEKTRKARMLGLPVRQANVLSATLREQLSGDIGKLLALTPNDELNALATVQWSAVFGRAEVYQVAPRVQPARLATDPHRHLRGHFCFGTYAELEGRFNAGAVVKTTRLSPEFDWVKFQELQGDRALPLFRIQNGRVGVVTDTDTDKPQPGDSLVYVADTLPPAAITTLE